MGGDEPPEQGGGQVMKATRRSARGFVTAGRLATALSIWLALAAAAHATRLTADELAGPGRFAVGVTTLTLVDPSRATPQSGMFPGSAVRTLPTDVYYPAGSDAPGQVVTDAPLDTADAPFPLLVFAHGLGGQRTNLTDTLAHLASHGYVVVAPDFPLTNLVTVLDGTTHLADVVNQPGDVSFEIDTFTGIGDPAGAPFAAVVDSQAVGMLGHSFGGTTTFSRSTVGRSPTRA
jgi:predicted dienelactone hydrolase